MDLDRPHFRTTSTGSTTASAATSELFICFTSRLSSSSSMKLTKSILSPGRAARDGGPVSLSSSLSRRLRTNGSLKGGQASPFFTTTGKKRGCAFENPEPSSPKVTCIGQVRVKTKKKVKQTRSLSRRRSGEVSFRKIESGSCGDEEKIRHSSGSVQYQQHQQGQECLPPHRNQRWVHLPVSICEALRAFGAEFSCLFPCKSSCFSTGEREKGEKRVGSSGNENGCGAVFARWLVSVNDGEGGKRREIELVVGGGDDEEETAAARASMRSSRRHVFDDIEVKDDRIEVKGQSEEEAARVSICIPPKNALLLMRCRSDPMKMAALANRFSWDAAHAPEHDIEEEEKEDDVEEEVEARPCEGYKGEAIEQDVSVSVSVPVDVPDEAEASLGDENGIGQGIQEEEELVIGSEEMVAEKVEEELEEQIVEEEEEEVESNMSSFEALLDQETYEDCHIQDTEQVEVEDDVPICHSPPSPAFQQEQDIENNPLPSSLIEEEEEDEEEEQEAAAAAAAMLDQNVPTRDQIYTDEEDREEILSKPLPEATARGDAEDAEALIPCEDAEQEEQSTIPPEMANPNHPELGTIDQLQQTEKGGNPALPECLLLMMCEPKLSMEVSKETWVCSTDFIRWLPERPRKSVKQQKHGACDHEPAKRRLSIDSKPKPDNQQHQQPPRSSCSSMTTMIEQKLVNAVGYEPFVLTRCKSEPMRTAAAKLMPDNKSCCWKNSMRKLEPHRMATLGVGAAGVGF